MNYKYYYQLAMYLLRQKIAILQRQLIHKRALEHLGVDASPQDIAGDELGCAESVTTIVKKVLPQMPVITGTWTLYEYLQKSRDWIPTTNPKPGDIILSPTGIVSKVKIGHVGIVGVNNTVMSSSSYNQGKWMTNYTTETWRNKYGIVFYYTLFSSL